MGAILRLGYGLGTRHSRLYLHECPGEDEQYLSIHNIYTSSGKEARTKVIEYFAISNLEAEQLATKYQTKKVGWMEQIIMQL
jgi:hypothetical protein